MSRYAENTSVSSDKSRTEIERILRRYGAEQFAYGWQSDGAMIAFVAHDRQIRFSLPLPDKNADEFKRTPVRRNWRDPEQVEAAYEQAIRQRWRALALVIKAKLEAVEAGITTFEDEFLAHTALPSGETVGQWIGPQLEAAYEINTMPSLLPGSVPAIEAELVE